MVKVQLPDGSQVEHADGVTVASEIRTLSDGSRVEVQALYLGGQRIYDSTN